MQEEVQTKRSGVVMAAGKRNKARVRPRYATKGLELVGESSYPVELIRCTGRAAEWRYRGRSITFTWQCEGFLTKESEVRIPSDLYELLFALSHEIMRAAFNGYLSPGHSAARISSAEKEQQLALELPLRLQP